MAARAETARERGVADSSGGKKPKRGFFSKLVNPAPRPTKSSESSEEPAERPAPVRGRPQGPMPRDDRGQVAGHRAAVFALVFAIASSGLLLFIKIPIERDIASVADAPAGCEIAEDSKADDSAEKKDDDEQLTCVENVTIPHELGLVAYPILAVPVIIGAVGFWATTRERQARIWTFCLVAFAVFLLGFAIGGLLFIPSMIALTVASFQSRRAEQKLLMAQHAAGVRPDKAGSSAKPKSKSRWGAKTIDTTASDTTDLTDEHDSED